MPPTGLPSGNRLIWLPRTTLGWVAVGLAAFFVFILAIGPVLDAGAVYVPRIS